MFKQICKRTLSVMLAVSLVFTTYLSLTASAAVTKVDPTYDDLYFIVPEAIYLKPAHNAYSASGSYDFQFYVNDTLNSVTNEVTTDTGESTTGKIFFKYVNAESVLISFKWQNTPGVDLDSTSCILYGDGSEKEPITGVFPLALTYGYGATTITGGTSPVMTASETGKYICWIATYVDKADGQTKEAYAYSYVYKPYAYPIAVSQKSVNTRGDNHYGDSIEWLSGVHGVQSERDAYPKTGSSYGLMPFASSAQVSDVAMPDTSLVDNLYFQLLSHFKCTGISNVSSGNWSTGNQSETEAPHKTVHHVSYTAECHSTGDDEVLNFVYSATGLLTVDNSRYTNLNQVPNLTVGVMVTDDEHSDSKASYFVANRTAHTPAYTEDKADYWHTSDSGTSAQYWNTYYQDDQIAAMGNFNNQTGNETEGVKINKRWRRAITSSETSNTYYLGAGYANNEDKGKDRILNVAELRCYINMYNKSVLRDAMIYAMKSFAVNNTALLGAGSISWLHFEDLYAAVAKELCKVDGVWENTSAAGVNYKTPAALAQALINKTNEIKAMSNTERKHSFATQYHVRVYSDNGTWKLCWGADNITSEKTGQYTVGAKVTYTAETPVGYTYVGYRTQKETATTAGHATSGKANNVTAGNLVVDHANGNLNAYYYYLRDTYTIVFDANGGTEVPRMTYHIESVDTLPSTEREGFTFAGWTPVADAGTWLMGTVYAADMPLTNMTGNVTLRARWSAHDYTVTLNTNGGSLPYSSILYNVESTATLPTPTRNGYSFTGWLSGPEVAGNWSANTTYAAGTLLTGKYGDIELEAQWSLITYTITFKSEGADDTQMNYTIESTDTLPGMVRPGYTHGGWRTGYNVSGNWERFEDYFVDDPVTGMYGNITLNALWYVVNYTITFESDGEVIPALEMEYNIQSDELLPLRSKSGYNLSGWKPKRSSGNWGVNELIPALSPIEGRYGDVTLEAVWTPKTYSITYFSNGGAEVPSRQYDLTSTDMLPSTTRDGYIFLGWKPEASSGAWDSGTVYPAGTPLAGKYGDVHLIAEWESLSFEITFDGNGSTSGSMPSIEPQYNNNITLPPNAFGKAYTITYDGNGGTSASDSETVTFTFMGWNTQPDGSGTAHADESTFFYDVVGSMKLYAQWSEPTTVTLPNATRRGYNFVAWYTAPDEGNKVGYAGSPYTLTQTMTVYAHWTQKEYTISFHGNGATTGNTVGMEVKYNNIVNLRENGFDRRYTINYKPLGGTVTIDSETVIYTFTKWNTEADGSGTDYENLKNFTYRLEDDLDLYAQWASSEPSVTLPGATRTGYAFLGWYDSAIQDEGNLYGVTNESFTPERDTTMYAHWSAIEYTITFDTAGGDGVAPTMTYTIESTSVLPLAQRAGFQFAGWKPMAEVGSWSIGTTYAAGSSLKNKYGNITLQAQWTDDNYTITFDANGGEPVDNKVYNYTSVEKLPSTTREGYTFGGWTPMATAGNWMVGTVYPAGTSLTGRYGDVTLSALWTPKTNSIIFVGNGATTGAMDSLNPEFNSVVTLPENMFGLSFTINFDGNGGTVDKESETSTCVFTGWNTAPDGSGEPYEDGAQFIYTIDGNLTLYAQWSAPSPVTLPSASQTGFNFVGWFTAAEHGTPVGPAGASYNPAGNATLYAHWAANGYTIQFDGNGATSGVMFAMSANYNETVSLTSNTFAKVYTVSFDGRGGTVISLKEVVEHTFVGWNTKKDGSGIGYDNQATFTYDFQGDLTLYAQWSETTPVTVPGASRVGYEFKGWYETPDPVENEPLGLMTNDTYVPESDVTLYAHWALVPYALTFDAAGGSNVRVLNYNIESADVLPTTEKGGFTFEGWKPVESMGSWSSITTYPAGAPLAGMYGSVTLVAQWTQLEYIITFRWVDEYGDLETSTKPYTVGSTDTLPSKSRPGYYFDGWKPLQSSGSWAASEIYPAETSLTGKYGNVTLVAQQTPIVYKIKFFGNGGTGSMTEMNVEYDSEVTLPTIAFQRSYTITYEPGTGATADRISDSVTYNPIQWNTAADGSGTDYSDNKTFVYKTVGDLSLFVQWETPQPITLPGATKPGHGFTGWFAEEGDSAAFGVAGSLYTPTADVTMYAHWSAGQYFIHFDGNGANSGSMSDVAVSTGSNVTLPTNTFSRYYTVTYNGNGGIPGRLNDIMQFSFTAWNTQYDGGGQDYIDNDSFRYSMSSDMTLYAQWYAADPDVVLPNATQDGYSFAGWYDAPSGGNRCGGANSAYTVESDIILYAQWNPRLYTIYFDSNGGSEVEPITQYYGSLVDDPEEPVYAGYTFKWWAEANDSLEHRYRINYMPGHDVYLIAIWTINQYTITFDTDGGSEVEPLTANFKTRIHAPSPDPTKDGYTFAYWMLKNDPQEKEYVFKNMPAQNITLQAVWTPNWYTITFNTEDGEYYSEYAPFGSEVMPPEEPTKTGYILAGWKWDKQDGTIGAMYDGIVPAEDVNAFAVWTPITYDVVLYADTDVRYGTIESCKYDTEFTLWPAPRWDGYGFEGWALTENGDVVFGDKATVSNLTEIDGDIVYLYAIWTRSVHRLTFSSGGATNADQVEIPDERYVGYHEPITLPDCSALVIESDTESRTFLGWQTQEGNEYRVGTVFSMPDEDVTLSPLWSANYYTLKTLTLLVKDYRDAQRLPANETNDPAYVEGGAMAEMLNSDGFYDYYDFNTLALDAAYMAANTEDNYGLPQAQQNLVNGLANSLQSALDNLALIDADITQSFPCAHFEEGYYDGYMTGNFYPLCNCEHTYNTLLATIERILDTDDSMSLYTPESVEELRVAVYGDGGSVLGIVNEFAEAALKRPAQAYLEVYVDELAEAYHTLLQLKDADYSDIDSLIYDYLPTINKIYIPLEDLSRYYTADSVNDLNVYINELDREMKIIHQSMLRKDGDVYNELKGMIDSLTPLDADYTELFSLIYVIPRGTPGFSLPANGVTDAVYSLWIDWARENAGTLSTAVDMDYLNTHYTRESVRSLNSILNGIDWNLSVFEQNTVNGSENATSYAKLLADAIEGLQERTYYLRFMYNDDSGRTEFQVIQRKYADPIIYPEAVPTRADSNYFFKGWSLDETELIPAGENDRVYSDMIFYANWGNTGEELVSLHAKEGSTTIIDENRKYIYGLRKQLMCSKLESDFLTVEGNGHLTYNMTMVGTGMELNLVNDYTGEVVDTYTMLIYGDLNGDGYINSSDLPIMKGMVYGSEDASFTRPEAFAADLNGDGDINNTDLTVLKTLIYNSDELDQATRELY